MVSLGGWGKKRENSTKTGLRSKERERERASSWRKREGTDPHTEQREHVFGCMDRWIMSGKTKRKQGMVATQLSSV